MTFRSRLPFNIYKQIFQIRESANSFVDKLQVVTDSTAIIYSIRILIILLALMMGYIHTPKDEKDVSSIERKEIIQTAGPKSIIDQIK